MAAPDAYWNDFAPRIDGYNNVLTKAIAVVAEPPELIRLKYANHHSKGNSG